MGGVTQVAGNGAQPRNARSYLLHASSLTIEIGASIIYRVYSCEQAWQTCSVAFPTSFLLK